MKGVGMSHEALAAAARDLRALWADAALVLSSGMDPPPRPRLTVELPRRRSSCRSIELPRALPPVPRCWGRAAAGHGANVDG